MLDLYASQETLGAVFPATMMRSRIPRLALGSSGDKDGLLDMYGVS